MIYIITLNWNGYNDTSELLESLKKISSPEFKVLVVDNNSSGDDVNKLKQNYKGFIDVIQCDTNLGFAGGNNVGINKALNDNADFVLLINNDTVVETDFLKVLVNKMESDQDIGIVAPQINYYDDRKKIWSAGGKISRIRGSGFAVSNKLENEISQTDRCVDFVSGCCMLIRYEVFQRVEMFDENFFLYTEDTDFCFRVKKTGYKIYLTPSSKIYHKVNRSTENKFSTLPLYYTTRNRLFFSKKNFKESYHVTVLYILFSMAIKSIIWFLTLKPRKISVVYYSFKDFFLNRMGKTEHNYFTDFNLGSK